MAGLISALELIRLGYDVKVFEARDVPGGRIQTLRRGFSEGVFAEAGAMFLKNLAIEYAQEVCAPLKRDFGSGPLRRDFLYFLDGTIFRMPEQSGKPIQWPFPLTETERKLGLDGIAKVYDRPLQHLPEEPVNMSVWPTQAMVERDSLSFRESMRRFGASEGALQLLSIGFNGLTGDGTSSYSALASDFQEQFLKEFKAGDTIVGGNDDLPRRMAARISEAIEYSAPVLSIGQSDQKVTLNIMLHGREQQAEGDYVICTVPFTVLKDIPVSPPFPEDKYEVIESLSYTSASRVCLEFSSPFWLESRLNGLVVTDLPNRAEPGMIVYPQPGQPREVGMLNVLMTGPVSQRVGEMSEQERVAFTMGEIVKFYPEARSLLRAASTKVWDHDPYARGAWAYFRPGEMVKMVPIIRRREGRIYFAGDHVSLVPGWIEGAVTSARQAAQAITNAAGMCDVT